MPKKGALNRIHIERKPMNSAKTITLPIEVLEIDKPNTQKGETIYCITVRLGEHGCISDKHFDTVQILAERGDPIGNLQIMTENQTYELAEVNLAELGIDLEKI